MRADRLLAVLLLLQSRGRVTAAEVADELEVSVRTARRDLEALAMSGVPVYSSRGRGGGWSLVGGARTDLTGLTKSEARALMLAASIGGAGQDQPGGDLRAAVAKLVQAMPETFRPLAAGAAGAVHVDPNRWSGGGVGPEPEWLEPLQQAVFEGIQVELGYGAPGREPTERRVHPLGLVTKAGIWYLVALTGRGRRTFRVSRVTSVEATGEPIERPPDFDLAAAWREIKADFSAQLSAGDIVATAVVEPWALTPLRALRWARVAVVDRLADGRFSVELSAESIEVLAYGFAGLGPTTAVEGPQEVIDQLAAVGRDLVARYGV